MRLPSVPAVPDVRSRTFSRARAAMPMNWKARRACQSSKASSLSWPVPDMPARAISSRASTAWASAAAFGAAWSQHSAPCRRTSPGSSQVQGHAMRGLGLRPCCKQSLPIRRSSGDHTRAPSLLSAATGAAWAAARMWRATLTYLLATDCHVCASRMMAQRDNAALTSGTVTPKSSAMSHEHYWNGRGLGLLRLVGCGDTAAHRFASATC